MKNIVPILLGITLGLIFLFAIGALNTSAAGNGKPTSPPGQGWCDRGNSTATCRPDPQPSHGADCDEHGKRGGINEDHCASPTPEATPSAATPSPSPSVEPSPSAEPTPTPPSSTETPGSTPSSRTSTPSAMPPTDTASDVSGDPMVALFLLSVIGTGAYALVWKFKRPYR